MIQVFRTVLYSFRGSLSQDDDVQFFDFNVGATSTVELRSYSYAGGTQADGTIIAAGGFDPILSLFDSSGARIGYDDDGAGGLDVYLSMSLDPGAYRVAVSQYNNFAGSTLSDPFAREGEGDFTKGWCPDATRFCNATGNWAFDILGVSAAPVVPDDPSAVPVPAGLPLLVTGLAAFGLLRRKS